MVTAANQMQVEVSVDRANQTYQPGEKVSGTIEVKRTVAPNVPYDSITLQAEGFMDTVSEIRGDLGRGPLPVDKRIMFMQKQMTIA